MKSLKKLLPVIFALACCQQVLSQSDSIFLVLNTNSHNKVATELVADRSDKYFITTSFDKTAKLWDANTGILISTFRVPIDQTVNGVFLSGSISPDNKMVAFGGFFEKDTATMMIFIFDLFANRIKKIINLKEMGHPVKFSKTGKFLAVCESKIGLNIYETKNWNLIKSDTDYYQKFIADMDFDQDDNLITIDIKGSIKLYNSSFKIQKTLPSLSNSIILNVKNQVIFSPDGKNIYVKKDSFHILILESKSLKTVYETDFPVLNAFVHPNYCKIAVSPDNQFLVLFRGYKETSTEEYLDYLTYWSIKDKKIVKNYNLANNYFKNFQVLSDNSLIFYSSDYSIGRMTLDSTFIFNNKPDDYITYHPLTSKRYFSTNETGCMVGGKPAGLSKFNFDIKNRALTVGTTVGELPNDSCSDFKVNFKISGSASVKLKSHDFNLPDPTIYAVDISSDLQKIIFGGVFQSKCYDTSGKLLWTVNNEDFNFGVNISGNGKVVVIIMQSGIFQWLRMSDGKVLLSLYVSPDMKRWILWTPKGYFDCAPGAEDLLGWHVNRGFDQDPLFYPLSKFRDKYYRPDIIDLVLEVYDEDEAIRLANVMSNRNTTVVPITQMLPPQVNILNPEKGFETSSNTFKVKYTVTSSNNELIKSVKILIDGRPFKTEGYSIENESDEITVTIPSASCKISIIAENRFGFSEAADLYVKWKAVAPKVENIEKPTLYILAIGISNYKDSSLKLSLAAKDAEDFSKTLEKQKGFLYKDVKVMLLTDNKATRSDIIDGLDWLQKNTSAKDVAMIFLAGHGVNDVSGSFYFLPWETDINKVKNTALLFAEIKLTVASIPGKVIVFADACHSGNIMGTKSLDVNGLVNSLSSTETGAIVFTSSTGRQFSLENKAWENGAFTKALIEGLSGKADYLGKGKITIKSLDLYVSARVMELTDGLQSPTTIVPVSIPDFALTTLK